MALLYGTSMYGGASKISEAWNYVSLQAQFHSDTRKLISQQKL